MINLNKLNQDELYALADNPDTTRCLQKRIRLHIEQYYSIKSPYCIKHVTK